MAPLSKDHKGGASRSKYTQAYLDQRVLSALLIFSLSIAFVACATGSAPPQATHQPTPTPTPAGPPSGTLLYQSNWSHGLAGWHASLGWKLMDGGMVLSDLSSNNSL